MHPGGGQDDFVESRDFSPTTTSPRSRSCRFTARGGEPAASLPTLSQDGDGAYNQREKRCEVPGGEKTHTSSTAAFVVNERNSRLHHQDQKTVRLEMRLRFKGEKTAWPRGLFSSTVPLSTEQNYLLYL